MAKQLAWERISEIMRKCQELGLTYKAGAARFGVSVWQLYEYNEARNTDRREEAESAVSGDVDADTAVEGATAICRARDLECGIQVSPDMPISLPRVNLTA